MALRDHMIKNAWDLFSGSPLKQGFTVPDLMLIALVLVEITFLFCYATLCNNMSKHRDPWPGYWKPLTWIDNFAEFGLCGFYGIGDETFVICHATTYDHVINARITLWVDAPHFHYCAKFGVCISYGTWYKTILFCCMTTWSKGHAIW